MLSRGLVAEVEKLLKNLTADRQQLPSLKTVGYRQVIGYLNGDYGHEEMRKKAKAATRQLAKRQLTWLRRQEDLHWINADDNPVAAAKSYIKSAL